MEVEWAGTSQVARRFIRVGVWEVHGGCARKGGWIGSTGEHVSCVVGLDAERFVRYITKMEKIPIQGKSELTRCGKKSKPENDTKNKHGHQSRPQMMPNRSLEFQSLNKCLD